MIRRYTFLQKILILFLGGVMIPMLILNVVYYRQTEVNIQEEMLEKINEALDDKAEKIAGALSGVLSLAGNYYNNEMLYRYLDLEYGGDLEYLIQYQEELRRIFTDSSIYLYQVKNVMAYTDNNTLFNSSFIRKITNPEDGTLGENLSYLNVLPMGTDGNAWFRVAHEDVRFQKVYDSRSISILYHLNHYRQYSEYRKLLRINLDLERMEEILLESNLFDNMLLTDSNGRVFAAAKQYSNKGEMEIFAAAEEEKDGRMVLRRKIQDFPVILYGIYDTKMISEEFRQSRRLSGSISLVCMLFALVCVCAVAGSINRRLRRLVAQSEEIARGNFVRTELAEAGRDEFTILERSLNHMSAQLQELIEKEYEARISQAELEKETNQAKLLALQAQVNPHFMFNALESIRLKAMIKGERETAGMIKYMAKMFRNILDWQDEFSYEINVTDQAYECLIPKMTLQPLAENACVHGVEAVSSNRRVRVEASVEKEWLKLRVEDNGGGMSPEKLRELKAMLKGEAEAGKSVGLWNIYRRLVLYYQENFRFDIDSVVGEGTTCTIRIPVKYANSD